MVDILESILESARFVSQKAKDVQVNTEKITMFLEAVPQAELEKLATKPDLIPVQFRSIQDEINFLCVLDLLNFGSGFRHLLHSANGRGAYETMKFGVMSMYISGAPLSASWMSSLALSDVSAYFKLPLATEKKLNEAMIVMEPTPLRPLVIMIHQVLTETGKILQQSNYEDFYSLVTGFSSCEEFVSKMSSLIPAFCDVAQYNQTEVKILKKVQLLCANLQKRKIKDSSGKLVFDFKDLSKLTVMSDNVLATVLRGLGILELSEDLARLIDTKQTLPPGPQEVELRLCAVYASDLIVNEAKRLNIEHIQSPVELDFYLWNKGKQTGFRQLERHSTTETFFY